MNLNNLFESLGPQQRRAGQLPAEFDPKSTSPVLNGPYGKSNATQGYLVGESQDSQSLAVGDPVIITGPVRFRGRTGDVKSIGQDGSFVVVNLYNYGPQSFQASDVSRNDYADRDEEEYQEGVSEENKAQARGLAPVSSYVELMQSLGWFMSMTTSKIAQDAVDNNGAQELKAMQQQFNKPVMNGKTFFEIISDISLFKNPKVAKVLVNYTYTMIPYIEARIKKYVKPEHQAKWQTQIDKLKNHYRAVATSSAVKQGVAEGSQPNDIAVYHHTGPNADKKAQAHAMKLGSEYGHFRHDQADKNNNLHVVTQKRYFPAYAKQQGVAEGEGGFDIEDMVMDQYRNGNDVWEIAQYLGIGEDEVQDIIDSNEQGVAEGRTKELAMDLEDPLMSDEEFATKYGDSREAMQGRAGRVQDRRSGEWYDPAEKFDQLKNSPEFQAQMKRMAQREDVAESDVWYRGGKILNPTIPELEEWIKNLTGFHIGGNLTDAGRAKVAQRIAKARRILAKKKQQQQKSGVTEDSDAASIRERIASLQRDLKAVTGNYPGDDRNRTILRRQIFDLKAQLKAAGGKKSGVAEASKEKTPGVALSKAYQKDFDGIKPVNRRPETALTGTYSKTGKPGGELKQRSVEEGLGKTIKRSIAGWGAFDKDKPKDVVNKVKGQDTDVLKRLSDPAAKKGKGSPAELQQKAIGRELKKRDQGVSESYDLDAFPGIKFVDPTTGKMGSFYYWSSMEGKNAALSMITNKQLVAAHDDGTPMTWDEYKQALDAGNQGVSETNVEKYKDLGATNQTTHFIKNVTTGKIVSPHRSLADAENALVGNERSSNDRFKIVRARKSGVAEGVDPATYPARAQEAHEKYLKYENMVDQELRKLGQRLPQSWDAARMHQKLSSDAKYALALKYYDLSEKFASLSIRYEELAKKRGVTETALKDKEDLAAKRRALQDLSRNPGVDQKAVQQRQRDLEKEAKSRDVAEDEFDQYETGVMDEQEAVAAMFTRLARRGRDPIDMIANRFGWGTHELDDLAQANGFADSAEWLNSFEPGLDEAGHKIGTASASLNEFVPSDDEDEENPLDDYPCYDCGSTIYMHHTRLCDLAEPDAVRDLPAEPGTQHWTGRVPKGLTPIPGLNKGVAEGVELMTDAEVYRETLGVLALMATGFAVGAYAKIKDIVKMYNADQIMRALEGYRVGNISDAERRALIKLLPEFKQAMAQRQGEQALAIANRIKSIATDRSGVAETQLAESTQYHVMVDSAVKRVYPARVLAESYAQSVRVRKPQSQVSVVEAHTTEDVVSNVKDRLGDYLQNIADAVRKDPDLLDKIANSAAAEDLGPAIKTLKTEDGREIKIHGNEDDGFRISIGNQAIKSKFTRMEEAVMATEMYCARRRQRTAESDYLPEA